MLPEQVDHKELPIRKFPSFLFNLSFFVLLPGDSIRFSDLPETIESDVGLLRNPISSGEHRSDLTGFSSDSGPEYIGKIRSKPVGNNSRIPSY